MKTIPTLEAREPVRIAVEALVEREADLREAEAELRARKAGVEEARSLDKSAYADARDMDMADPGPMHLERAEHELESAERVAPANGYAWSVRTTRFGPRWPKSYRRGRPRSKTHGPGRLRFVERAGALRGGRAPPQ
jgi:hypothetical protein